MPSTTQVNGQLALRPCFVGARSNMSHARALVADVLRIGAELVLEVASDPREQGAHARVQKQQVLLSGSSPPRTKVSPGIMANGK